MKVHRALPLAVVMASLAAAAAERSPPLRIQADHVEASGLTEKGDVGRVVATGHVRARSGAMLLRAPKLEFDRHKRTALVEGGVTGVEGLLVFAAKRLSLDLDTRTLSLDDGRLIVKRRVSARELAMLERSASPEAARAVGHNALIVRARKLTQRPDRSYSADDAWLTTCDCPERATPLLAVAAEKVHIVPNDRATLYGWTFLLHGFRLPFSLPIPLSFPIVPRKSGLLFPNLVINGLGGYGVELPLFLTLGRSWDVTLRARWFSGNPTADSRADSNIGVRGFGGEAELRWRPAIDSTGALTLTGLDDTSMKKEGEKGARAEVAFAHDQMLGGGHLGLHADVVTDNALLVDTVTNIDRAATPYLRDEATYSRAFGGLSLAFESAVIQALRRFPLPRSPTLERFALADTPATVAPAARLVLGDTTALGRATLDEAATIAWEAPTPGLALAPGRSRRLATDLSLGQTLPVLHGIAGTIAVETGERLQGFSSPGAAPYGRLGAFAELNGESVLERAFQNGWRHDIEPSFRIRGFWSGGSGAFAQSAFLPRSAAVPLTSSSRAPQSELDLALFPQPMVQAIARIATSLSHQTSTPVSVYLEHHLALWPLEAGQLQAGFSGTLPKRFWEAHLGLSAAWNASDQTFAGASSSLSAHVQSAVLSLGASYVAANGSDEYDRPLDLLFTPHSLGTVIQSSTPVVSGVAAASWQATGALHLDAGAGLTRTLPAGTTAATYSQRYSAAVAYDASGCARLSAGLLWTLAPGEPTSWPSATLSFDLGDFASALGSASASTRAP